MKNSKKVEMKEQIMAVQRMQDYIEEHLDQEITLFIPYGVKFRELRKLPVLFK